MRLDAKTSKEGSYLTITVKMPVPTSFEHSGGIFTGHYWIKIIKHGN
jgi:hypothetical protein